MGDAQIRKTNMLFTNIVELSYKHFQAKKYSTIMFQSNNKYKFQKPFVKLVPVVVEFPG